MFNMLQNWIVCGFWILAWDKCCHVSSDMGISGL
jgi:hypothetical protein